MLTRLFRLKFSLILLLAVLAVSANTLSAQTTEFTYQGRLTDSLVPANTGYDFEFSLFDVDTGGTALATVQRPGVAVSNGVFSVKLDFGAQFPGSSRYLEIAVKPVGGGSYTTLTPRQAITSAPYSVRSINAASADSATNAAQLGGTAASQFVQTSDPRLSDARPPSSGSSSYIQNGTTTQASSEFNISGDGTAGGTLSGNLVNADTQFRFGGSHVLSATGTNNLFAARIPDWAAATIPFRRECRNEQSRCDRQRFFWLQDRLC